MYDIIANAKRIVVKVGTSTLTHSTGGLNIRRAEILIKVLSDIKNMGKEIILVSSGAISVGACCLGFSERPRETVAKQAAAAVGQCELMKTYSRMFNDYGHNVAQILLTKDVLTMNESKKNAVNTFLKLLEYGVIPIVNENDTISTDEEEFGDNDRLSAVVATLCSAEVLILLTDIDGVFDHDPRTNANAHLIPVIDDVESIIHVAGGAGSSRGTGGMLTKLMAGEIAKKANIHTIIANGFNPKILYDITDGKPCGTLIRAYN